MNREIKFRAWDKIEKRMWPVNLINFENEVAALEGYQGEPIEVIPGHFSPRLNKPLSLLILMQYTDLKDKNGKEIYEGDIVKFDNTVMTVEWEEDKAGFILYQKPWQETHDMSPKCEVIGNIHQNSELLK